MELKDVVLKAISEKKGYDIRVYDCRQLTPFLDEMVVASTSNIRQNNAIAQNIKDRIREAGFDVDYRVEGDANSRWILIDMKSIVVHLFVNEERQVYQLDRLYSDMPVTVYDV